MFEDEILGDVLSTRPVSLSAGKLQLTKQVDQLEHLNSIRQLEQLNNGIDGFFSFMDLVPAGSLQKSDAAAVKSQLDNEALFDGIIGELPGLQKSSIQNPLFEADLDSMSKSLHKSGKSSLPSEAMMAMYEKYEARLTDPVRQLVLKAIKAMDYTLFLDLMREFVPLSDVVDATPCM